MANNKSAEKRIRVAERNRIRNKGYKTKMKTAIKNVEALINAGQKEEALAALSIAQKQIDKAAHKSSVHKNKANRDKSKLHSKIIAL